MDQFYTTPTAAALCIEIYRQHIDFALYDVILEPSAGRGAFFDLLPPHKRIGIDIDPKEPHLIRADFLAVEFTTLYPLNVAVIGNPPFGRVSSMAVKFFNHAALFADAIGFIVPRTFKRVSVQNRLDMAFELIHSSDLPPGCFVPNMAAKCCFQVWRRGAAPRIAIALPTTHDDFEFIQLGPLDEKKQPTPPVGADFALKAYGGGCGKIVRDIADLAALRPKSWHWIRSKKKENIDTIIARFAALDYTVSRDTVRQDSIGRGELIALYRQHMSDHMWHHGEC